MVSDTTPIGGIKQRLRAILDCIETSYFMCDDDLMDHIEHEIDCYCDQLFKSWVIKDHDLRIAMPFGERKNIYVDMSICLKDGQPYHKFVVFLFPGTDHVDPVEAYNRAMKVVG